VRIGGDCEGESERVSNNDLYGNDSVSIQAVRATREREREILTIPVSSQFAI